MTNIEDWIYTAEIWPNEGQVRYKCTEAYRQLAAAVILHALWDFVTEDHDSETFQTAEAFLMLDDFAEFMMGSLGLEPDEVRAQAQARRDEFVQLCDNGNEVAFRKWRKTHFPAVPRFVYKWRKANDAAAEA